MSMPRHPSQVGLQPPSLCLNPGRGAGTTSQPSMGALVNALAGTPLDTGIDAQDLSKLSTFWCALVSTGNAVVHFPP